MPKGVEHEARAFIQTSDMNEFSQSHEVVKNDLGAG